MATMALKLAVLVGGMILSAVLAPKPKDQYGPRLSDINVAQVSPGNPIIRHWGTMKLPGQAIWISPLIETEHVEEVGGGKKGGGGKKSSQKVYTYTYSVDCAIAICKGPVHRINRIWANQKLLWVHPDLQNRIQEDFTAAYYAELDRLVNQEGVWNTDEAYAGAFFFAFNNYIPDEYTYHTKQEAKDFIRDHPGDILTPPVPPPNMAVVGELIDMMLDSLKDDQLFAKLKMRFDSMNLYLGSEEQLPNSKLEEYMGIGNVPAYRGVAYMVIRNLQLEDFGNSIPTFNIEVEKTDSPVLLHNIITDICHEAGLQDDEFDGMGYLPTDIEIHGFAVTQPASARQVLNNLQSVFPFEGAESGYRLVFSWVNERPQAIIRREDFGAHADSADKPVLLETTRAHDADLPRRINLSFQEPVRSYSPNKVMAQRIFTESQTIDDIDITMAMTRAQAKACVEEMLAMKFTARKSHKVYLPKKYVILEPGDRVLVQDPLDPTGWLHVSWRVVSVDIGADGILEFVFTEHNFHPEVPAITEEDFDDDPDAPDDDIPSTSMTHAYMLDTPLISDTEDDNVGFYTVLTGSSNGWPGGVLVIDVASGGEFEVFGESYDNENAGSRWYVVSQNNALVPHGFAMSTLSPNAVPGVWDYESRVNVFLYNKRIDFTDADPNDMMSQPLNAAIIGNEYVQFARAENKGNGIWELSQFLRGQRGTEVEIANHVRGERFVRLRIGSVKRITHDAGTLYRPATFRAITMGEEAETAKDFTFTNTGNSLRPYAPAIVQALKRDNGDVDLEWSPRVRQNGGLISGQETQLDQPFEKYEIDVVSEDGSTVYRTVSLENTRTWTYTAAMQTTDRGSSVGISHIRVYQIGQIIGRGFAAKVAA